MRQSKRIIPAVATQTTRISQWRHDAGVLGSLSLRSLMVELQSTLIRELHLIFSRRVRDAGGLFGGASPGSESSNSWSVFGWPPLTQVRTL